MTWRCTDHAGSCEDVTGCDTAGRCLHPTTLAPDRSPDMTTSQPDEGARVVIRAHTRLTWAERPFVCSCDPHTSDGTQSFTEHLIAAYTQVAFAHQPSPADQPNPTEDTP